MGRFDSKVVLVTGAASGIGQASARRFASDGATLVCADIHGDGAEETAAAARDAGATASAVQCDVSDPAATASAVKAAVSEYGSLHVLANIAGVGQFTHTTDLTFEEWQRVIDINLTGVFNMSKAAIPHLLEVGGNIVNVSSTAGVQGQPYSAAYCASKGGVTMLTKALAVEYTRRGLRVNCICPGGVATPLLQQFSFPPDHDQFLIDRLELIESHYADPADIASVLTFLASDEARNVSGAAWTADLGMTA